ncbi:MAG: outer membrane protein assembly factor BamD [Planctomycetota bacterium]|jgi:hypothetical protein
MLKHRIRLVALAVTAALSASWTASAANWRLDQEQPWREIPAERRDSFLVALGYADSLVNSGQAKAAQEAFDALRNDFPEIAGPDLDVFIEAEVYYSEGKLAKTIRTHDKLLTEHVRSSFRNAALHRQFAIAKRFLAGEKKSILGIIKMRRYGEGIAIMEKITDRTGFDTVMGTDAALAVARNYEQRKKFNEAYLKWWEISLHWQRGPLGRDALHGMARTKLAVYNSHPEHKRSFFDASSLTIAKSSYEKFSLLYPEDAREIGAYKKVSEIDGQLAKKQLTIGRYYQKVGNIQAANLYYDMVVKDWATSKAAETARQLLAENQNLANRPETPSEK